MHIVTSPVYRNQEREITQDLRCFEWMNEWIDI